jgi:radical SAM superfamily enzyme YgiQ (UPF0313 family)
MNKKVTVEQIRKALAACKEAGIATIASFIIPAPSETEETKKETLDLILETLPDNVNVFAPALVRGSEWDINAERYHFQIGSKEAFHKGAMTFKGNVRWPVLWRPLPDYKMNDKTFSEIAEETYHFIRSLEEKGISTQIYDQVFLFAKCARMSPQELRRRTNSCIVRGDHQELGKIVSEINKNVLMPTKACCCRK